jgi:hypothetical protein
MHEENFGDESVVRIGICVRRIRRSFVVPVDGAVAVLGARLVRCDLIQVG